MSGQPRTLREIDRDLVRSERELKAARERLHDLQLLKAGRLDPTRRSELLKLTAAGRAILADEKRAERERQAAEDSAGHR